MIVDCCDWDIMSVQELDYLLLMLIEVPLVNHTSVVSKECCNFLQLCVLWTYCCCCADVKGVQKTVKCQLQSSLQMNAPGQRTMTSMTSQVLLSSVISSRCHVSALNFAVVVLQGYSTIIIFLEYCTFWLWCVLPCLKKLSLLFLCHWKFLLFSGMLNDKFDYWIFSHSGIR